MLSSMPVEVHDVLKEMLQRPTLFQDWVKDGAVRRALDEYHSETWFSVKGCGDIARSYTGTKPGVACADLIFCCCLQPVLLEIDEGLHNAGCAVQLSQ
eukprot:8905111-Karenia_brevis.AAC.1